MDPRYDLASRSTGNSRRGHVRGSLESETDEVNRVRHRPARQRLRAHHDFDAGAGILGPTKWGRAMDNRNLRAAFPTTPVREKQYHFQQRGRVAACHILTPPRLLIKAPPYCEDTK